MREKLVEFNQNAQIRKVIRESEGASSNVWTAPVWNLGVLNLNGRVYTEKLAQRLVAENAVTGVCDGHEPSMEKDFENYRAVAKNPSIKDGQLWVEIHFTDDAYAERINRLHAEGLPIGVSSVGYGECDKDGVVKAESYELVRYMDFVTFPAGEVYAEPTKEEEKPAEDTGNVSEATATDNESAMADAKASRIRQLEKINDVLRRNRK